MASTGGGMQKEFFSNQMESLIAALVVFPTLLILLYNFVYMDKLSTVALATPALAFVSYKRVASYGYSKWLLRKKNLTKKFGAVVFAGAALMAASIVSYLPKVFAVGGFTIAIAGAIGFSVVFVHTRKRDRLGDQSMLSIAAFCMILGIFFISIQLLGTYGWQMKSKKFVIFQSVVLVMLFFHLAIIHGGVRMQVPNWLNFVVLLCLTLAATVSAVAVGNPVLASELPNRAAVIDEDIVFPDIPCSPSDVECAGMMKFSALECCLFVVYLMMATMRKADEQSAVPGKSAEAEAVLPTVSAAFVFTTDDVSSDSEYEH